jgi:2,3-dimethylmalate lyase
MTDQQKRARLRDMLADPEGAIAPGVTDALFARLVQDCGYTAAHLSGNAIHKNFCLPDHNLLTVTQIAQRAAQIAEAVDIPLIVDGGPAWVDTAALMRAVKLYERAGAAGLRFEDSLSRGDDDAGERMAIAPQSEMADRIKAAVDSRSDPSLVVIARCDARPQESLDKVQERLAAYADAGADALGVQLSDPDEFRRIGSSAKAPLVSMWPRTKMTVFEFLQMGFCLALMPSSVALAALAAAREMLLELKRAGHERDYFTRQEGIADTERWYKDLGQSRP